jgi:hypothetical protein
VGNVGYEQRSGTICRFGCQADTFAPTATCHVLVVNTKVDVTAVTNKTVTPSILLIHIVYIAMSWVFSSPEVESAEEVREVVLRVIVFQGVRVSGRGQQYTGQHSKL